MKTIGEVLKLSADYLARKGIDHPRRQVEELLSHVLGLPRIELYLQFDRPLESQELDRLRAFLKRRGERMPWQYIVGKVEFLGCEIALTPDVLIPRQETEILAEMVLKELPTRPVIIWDLCCGSGCIGISIKKKRPDCTVILSDLSSKAATQAMKNAVCNEVDVEVREGDLTSPFKGSKADVVICNPPYVSEEDYLKLDPEVRKWEPKMALVGGAAGYEFYNRLAEELPLLLNPGATVYFEIGAGMGDKTKSLFNSWGSATLIQDFSAHDRFLRVVGISELNDLK